MSLSGSRPGCSHSGGGSCTWARGGFPCPFHGSEALGPLSTVHSHSEHHPHSHSPRPSASHTPQKKVKYFRYKFKNLKHHKENIRISDREDVPSETKEMWENSFHNYEHIISLDNVAV